MSPARKVDEDSVAGVGVSFKDREWSARFSELGDEGEAQFEDYCAEVLKVNFVRYGLNRPPLQLSSIPARIRYTPDFLLSRSLVEVQGLGRDQQFKLKMDKWGALHHWNDIRTPDFTGVKVFVWDSHKKRACMIPLLDLDRVIGEQGALATFPEGKPYFSVAADAIFEAADVSP